MVDHRIVLRHIYHSTAGCIEGYLDTAAAAEDRYLKKRMGGDYREQIREMAQDSRIIGASDL
jgi:hypothetical protein